LDYPEVEVDIAKENRVLCSFNDCVAKCPEDIVILLNNDMELDSDFVDPLIEPFLKKEDVFFVATSEDRSIADLRYGLLSADIHYPGHEALNRREGLSFSAGVAAFDRKKFCELEGYDELYLPGRYEDVDLCYRGWKRGWKGIYQPASKKMHLGGASFEKAFSDHETQAMVFRNAILFTVKNITDVFLLLKFFFWLPVRLIAAVFTGKLFFLSGFAQALRWIPKALSQRRKVRKSFARKDREILNEVNAAWKELVNVRDPRKRLVNFIALHPFLRKTFAIFGFFTLRLFFPLQYLLLCELMDATSVLDLGCGKQSMVPIIPSWIYTVGVELFEADYQDAVRKRRHHEYVCADILKVDFPEKSFDVVILLDVLEHLPKDAGREILWKMEKWARRKVIVFTPNGFLPQDDYNENPHMDHQSGWDAAELRELGFWVHGVRGFKWCYGKSGFWGRLLAWTGDLLQVVTYNRPEKAFHLFCVKEMR
jgi:2-polyprenyl-3-methyl-5-hydroxy-6-metoxy-1,4-benzoquinol methylase